MIRKVKHINFLSHKGYIVECVGLCGRWNVCYIINGCTSACRPLRDNDFYIRPQCITCLVNVCNDIRSGKYMFIKVSYGY